MGAAPVLALELTDLEVGGQVYAIGSNQIRMTAQAKKPGKKILGGAALGAGIGAIVDGGDAVGAVVGAAGGTAAAAASGGNQVSVSAGGSLDFHFTRPLTVAVLTASGVHTD
jgi:hypothetical protein